MRCAHHPACPGCPLMGQPPAEQLAVKGARLAAALGRFPHLGLPAIPPVRAAARDEGYRHRLKLPVAPSRQGLQMGLVDKRTGRIVHTPDCPVLAPGLRAAVPPLLAALEGRGGVHSVDLRVSALTGELQLVLAVRKGKLPGGADAARALMQAVPGLVSVALSEADPEGKRVMGARPKVIAGRERVVDRIGRTDLHIHPGAFFQVDPLTAAELHRLVADGVGRASSVLDLYAGVGAYARMLAPGRRRVVAVEEVPAAAAAAREGAPPHLEVRCGRVEDEDLRKLGRFDAVVLNPARRGADPGTLAAVAALTDRVVMVSCGPETLARDLDVLAFHGLRVEQITPIDLFPQTPEVETVVTLSRGRPLLAWPSPGGRAQGPWGDAPSGAVGRPTRAVVLVIGDPGEAGSVRGARYRRLGLVAGHGLLRLDLDGPLVPALSELARQGHPVAGRHKPTDRFFAEKAGLQRPFVHVELAGEARAPLHGDLVWALEALGANERLRQRAGQAQA